MITLIVNIVVLLLLAIAVYYSKIYIDSELQQYTEKLELLIDFDKKRKQELDNFAKDLLEKYQRLYSEMNKDAVYWHQKENEAWVNINAQLKQIKNQQDNDIIDLKNDIVETKNELSKVRNMLAKCKKTKKEASWK